MIESYQSVSSLFVILQLCLFGDKLARSAALRCGQQMAELRSLGVFIQTRTLDDDRKTLAWDQTEPTSTVVK